VNTSSEKYLAPKAYPIEYSKKLYDHVANKELLQHKAALVAITSYHFYYA
jgi:hypothetical protein